MLVCDVECIDTKLGLHVVYNLPIPKFDDRFARQNRIRASTRVSPGFTLFRHSSPSAIINERGIEIEIYVC